MHPSAQNQKQPVSHHLHINASQLDPTLEHKGDHPYPTKSLKMYRTYLTTSYLQILVYFIFTLLLQELFSQVEAVELFRISTQEILSEKISVGDELVSTLGYFRAKLQSNPCRFDVRRFNYDVRNYIPVGNISIKPVNSGNMNCQFLKILPGKVITDKQEQTIIKLEPDSYNHSTTLTIDDYGIIRIIGSNKKQIIGPGEDLVSTEKTFNNFLEKNVLQGSAGGLIWTGTLLGVDFSDILGTRTNKNNWIFSAQFGQLNIKGGVGINFPLTQKYFYHKFNIRNSRITDFTDYRIPFVILANITNHPPCSRPKSIQYFHAPYTIQIDPFWPIVNVYEQGKYKIFEILASKLLEEEYRVQQNNRNLTYHYQYSSPCPRKTFQYLGDCVAFCPQPFFHEIRGDSNKCVLICEQNSIVNYTSRICNCMTLYQIPFLNTTKKISSCPPPSKAFQTPLGCYCKVSGYYYDYTESLNCVPKQKCPSNTFPINALCMQCPANCEKCTKDNQQKLTFLKCVQCAKGYRQQYGRCIKKCIKYEGNTSYYNEQTCIACNDTNCTFCTLNGTYCLGCKLPYTLVDGRCQQTCSAMYNYQPVYSGMFNFQCIFMNDNNCQKYISGDYKGRGYLKCDRCREGFGFAYQDKCVTECPQGTVSHNNRYCVCSINGNTNLTILNQCSNSTACPIKMSFDSFSFSCIPCPFGCISCTYSSCTSCYPGYYLQLSPIKAKLSNCIRLSSHLDCKNQYEFLNGNTCKFKELTSNMIQCRGMVLNCSVCQPFDKNICLRCQEPLVLYNNTCLQSCPRPLIKYQQTCILPEIQNCQIPYLQPNFTYFETKQSILLSSEPYKYFINFFVTQDDQNEITNPKPQDPIGYTERIILNMNKNNFKTQYSSFYQPYWICMKCIDGFGLTTDKKRCQPCPKDCQSKKCYYARSSSCIIIHPPDANPTPTPSYCENQYIDKTNNECIKSCSDQNKIPKFENGKLYCVIANSSQKQKYIKMDSAAYINSDNQVVIYYVFDKIIISNTSNTISIIETFGSQVALPKLGQGNQTQNEITVQNNQFFQILLKADNGNLAKTGASIKLHVGQIQSIDGFGFPNSVYGSTFQTSRNNYMKTWLAFIGYFMSLAIVLMHAVFIGLDYCYQVDNLLIFVQGIYYFLFVKLLIGKLLSQFYYGWFFAHGGFLTNFFQKIIPGNYVQLDSPPSYKLVNMDGNYFRNAGFSLAWVLIFYGAYIIIVLFIKYVVVGIMRKRNLWYPQTLKQAALSGFQFFSMNLFYFSVSQLKYSGDSYKLNKNYYDASQGMAITTIVFVVLYSIVRFKFNQIGGLYMFKRILYASILVTAYENNLYLIPVILLEVVFSILRFFLENVYLTKQKSQIFTIIFEAVLLILCYLLLFLVVDTGVNTLIISIIVFIFIIYLAYDFVTIYLESRNQFQEKKLQKMFYQDKSSRISTQKEYRIVSKEEYSYQKGNK